MADADHFEHLGDTGGLGGFGAVETGAFGGSEVAGRIVRDGFAGVEVGVEDWRFGGTFTGGAPRGQ